MLRAYGRDFVRLGQIVDDLWAYADESYRAGDHEEQTDYVAGQLLIAAQIAEHMPFPSVAAQIRRTSAYIQVDGYSVLTLFEFLKELRNRLTDDAETIQFLRVQPEHVRLYESADLFGEKVSNSFPNAIDDIADAGKCLALGQGTATVFHLSRVMEVGLKALAGSLGIPYAPSWESYLKQINAQLSAEHKTKTEEWKKEEPFYRDVVGDLSDHAHREEIHAGRSGWNFPRGALVHAAARYPIF